MQSAIPKCYVCRLTSCNHTIRHSCRIDSAAFIIEASSTIIMFQILRVAVHRPLMLAVVRL